MRKKEMIDNNCQLCDHSAKEYLCIKNSFMLQKASFCMCLKMSVKERKNCLNGKVKCEHFKPAKIGKEEQLTGIKEIMNLIDDQLKAVAYMLNKLNETNETND